MRLLIILLFPSLLLSQIKLTPIQDLTFDYYRGMGVSLTTSLIVRKITKRDGYSGIAGFAAGCLQGILLERGSEGKIISCMGSFGGTFIYIPICISKIKRDEKRLALSKGKL